MLWGIVTFNHLSFLGFSYDAAHHKRLAGKFAYNTVISLKKEEQNLQKVGVYVESNGNFFCFEREKEEKLVNFISCSKK